MNIIVVNNWITQSSASTPTDPNFSDVDLLLKMEGSNGGTSFTDSSNNNRTVTAVGNAQTSTAQKKFGSSSLLCDGFGDYLSLSENSDTDIGSVTGYGRRAFTIETFVRVTSTSATSVFFGKGGGVGGWNTTNGHQYLLFLQSSNFYWQWWTSGFGPNNISASTSSLGFNTNTWYHVAVSYDGTTSEVYFNGSRVGTSTAVYNKPSSSTSFRVAGSAAGNSTFGYLDNFRLTNDVSRYTGSTITVPSTDFPES